MAMLEVKNLGISFGGLKAVDDFSITIEKGQLYGLIGPNGAGKTTIFNLLDRCVQAGCADAFCWMARNITGQEHHRDQSGRHRENLPEYPSVQGAERA